MVGALAFVPHRQGAHVDRFGFAVAALLGIERAQVRKAARDIRMFRSAHLFSDGDGALERGFGLFRLSPVGIDAGQAVERERGGGDIRGPIGLALADRNRPQEHRFGFLGASLRDTHHAEVGEHEGHPAILGAEGLFENLQRAFVQRLGLDEARLHAVALGDPVEEQRRARMLLALDLRDKIVAFLRDFQRFGVLGLLEEQQGFLVHGLPRRHALRRGRRAEDQGKKYGKRETQNRRCHWRRNGRAKQGAHSGPFWSARRNRALTIGEIQ